MSVEHVWAGATTDTSAWVRGRVSGTSARLAVSTAADLSDPVFHGPATPTGDNMVSIEATGLDRDTRYYYALEVDGAVDTEAVGTLRTHPAASGERASFTIGAAGDAGLTGVGDDSHVTDDVSNNPVFDTMRQQARADDWLQLIHLGDLHYRDIGSTGADLYRDAYNDVLTFNGSGTSARQGRLYRNAPIAYLWDDHDFGINNSDRTALGRDDACQVYRERVPHYDLPAGSGANPIYQTWQIGRVLFIGADVRADRDPNSDPQAPSKTMLGSAQKTWMERVLSTSSAEALVWCMPSRWLDEGSDTWDSFRHERAELVQMLGDLGWLERMVQLTADKHALAIATALGNGHGGFPVYMFASMDSAYGLSDPYYDLGQSPGRQRYGTLAVRDDGHTIGITGTGYINGTVWRGHTKWVYVGTPVLGLDYTAGHIHPPFEPTDDDQSIRNDVTAKRRDGGEVRRELKSGPMSVAAPPDGVGRYDESVTLNVDHDDQLPGQAGWRVHLGTVDQSRYPEVTLNLGANPQLADTVAALDSGDKVTIGNPPPWLPPETISMIAEGSTENLNMYRWETTLNASPGSPWTVGRVAGTEQTTEGFEDDQLDITITDGGDSPWTRTTDDANTGQWSLRAGTIGDGQTSDAVVSVPDDATEIQFSHRTSSERSSFVDEFERFESSEWGTSTSGHTWTHSGGLDSDRFVNSVAGIVALADDTTEWRFQTVAGEDLADCEVLTAVSTDQTAAGGTLCASVLLRYVDDANFYIARVHLTANSNVFISAWTSGEGQLGTNLNTGFDYTPGDIYHVRARITGQTIRMKLWAPGEDEPASWDIERTATTGTIASGGVGMMLFAFAGNTNTDPQLATHRYELSSEERPGDRFQFLIDGVRQLETSGEGTWNRLAYDVTNVTSVTFRYIKDSRTSLGDDTAYVDDIAFTAPTTTPDEPTRADTAGSVLSAGVDDTQTTFPVTTVDGPVWVTDATYPQEFPLDVRVRAEVMRVTGIADDPATVSEGFESADPDTLEIVTGGDAEWSRTDATSNTGSWSMRSGTVGHEQATYVGTWVPDGATAVQFAYRVSSESGFDGLVFQIDGVDTFAASGEVGWTTSATYDVTGATSVTWWYTKDIGTSTGDDAAWIDDVVFTIPRQAFTVTRGVNAVTQAHTAGTSLSLAHPAVVAL